MRWLSPDPNWQTTDLSLLALASVAFFMKLVMSLTPAAVGKRNRSFVFAPASLQCAWPLRDVPRLIRRTLLFGVAVFLSCWLYWKLVNGLALRGILLSYLAAPTLWLIGELAVCLVSWLWLPSGRSLPALHDNPLRLRGVSDF